MNTYLLQQNDIILPQGFKESWNLLLNFRVWHLKRGVYLTVNKLKHLHKLLGGGGHEGLG